MAQPTSRILLLLLLFSIASGVRAASIHPMIRPFLGPDHPASTIPEAMRGASTAGGPGSEARIAVWVQTRDGGASLEASRLLTPGGTGDLRSARWTRSELEAALADPNVVRIGPAVRCLPSLDLSLPETNLTLVHESEGIPPYYAGLSGAGILVGIVDSGIDLSHPDFLDGLGDTRLVSVWDQTVASSDPPRNFGYGKEWTAAQIDGGLATQTDTDGHGTHVAGIAAGNGAATGNGEPAFTLVGAAPESPLVVVRTDYLTTSVADGVDYIFQKADSLGIPAVVNLSLGTHYGPHDGTADFDLSLSALAGPGRLIVAAAGNETGDGIHAERIVSAPGSATISFVVPTYAPHIGAENDEIDFDGWYTGGSDLSISVITPGGTTVGPVPKGSTQATSTTQGYVSIDNASIPAPNGDHEVYIRIYDQPASNLPAPGTWHIQVDAISTPPPAGNSEFDLWTFYATMAGVAFYLGLDETELVGSPATADSVIAVAAYITKGSWTALNGVTYGYDPPVTVGEIASFSSVGPRRDGLLKPEVAAPGMAIGSARSAQASFQQNLLLPDAVHVISQGTSMAAPHVTGLVSLMMEQLGPLGVRAIRDRLTSTCRKDGFTGMNENTTWGHGKIDAVGATGYIVPVLLIEASAVQEGDRVTVRFLLTEDAGRGALPVYRQGPDDLDRRMAGWSSSGRERTFVDSTLTVDGEYLYWLREGEGTAADWIGPARVTFHRPILVDLSVAPNPFLNGVRIDWEVSDGGADLAVYDVSGRLVRTLIIAADPLSGALLWDATDEHGRAVPAGIYLVRLRAEGGKGLVRKVLKIE